MIHKKSPDLFSPASRIALTLVRLYQLVVSPLLTGGCRFTPTCSDYMTQAVEVHGVWRGMRLGATRLARCHPFGGAGDDPVPPSAQLKLRPTNADPTNALVGPNVSSAEAPR